MLLSRLINNSHFTHLNMLGSIGRPSVEGGYYKVCNIVVQIQLQHPPRTCN